MSFPPISFAATCASKSETLSSILRDYLNSYLKFYYWNSPSFINSNFSIATPYSSSDFENAGMLPGVIPPISAWWPREAKYILVPHTSVQVTTVRSGRWEPPAIGWFVSTTSPTFMPLLICYATAVSIEPRWTGKWGAFAKSFPSQSKIPHEKSNLSRMLVLMDIFCRILPISSAIDMSRVE